MHSLASTSSSGLIAPLRQIFGTQEEKAKGYNQSVLCPVGAAEKARIGVMRHAVNLGNLPFLRAGITWLHEKALHTDKPGTIECYRDYLKRLWTTLFREYKPAGLTLNDVHIGHFLEYQRRNKNRYHPASVNHDLNVLSQMLRRAGLWEPIRDHYRPLPLPEQDPPKVMSETEEDSFFAFASKNKEWQLAYFVASLTNNSTASGKELRMLRRGAIHLDFDPPYFHVPKNMKTRERQRNIPLNERGETMMERLLALAAERGSTRPEHYLFPFREKRNFWDPNRHASESWIKAQWKKLVDAAVEAKVISFRIKPHNLRHQAITKLLDYGVPIETVRQIAGHGVDSLVTRHYHHARMETLAKAINAIDPGKRRPDWAGRPGQKKERGA